jgi:hypothetical protein
MMSVIFYPSHTVYFDVSESMALKIRELQILRQENKPETESG